MRIEVSQNTEYENDYGIISNVNTTLADSQTFDTENVYLSCQGAPYVDVGYGCPTSGFFYIKYVKDNSTYEEDDTFKFKIYFTEN
jgi:hypothetical protein